MQRVFSVLVSMVLVVGVVLAVEGTPAPDPEMLEMLSMFEQMGNPDQPQLLAKNRPPAGQKRAGQPKTGMRRKSQKGKTGKKRAGQPKTGMRRKSQKGKTGKRIDLFLQLREELDLSEEQVEKIKSIKIESQKNLIRKKADKEIAQVELREILAKEDIDFSKAKSKMRELNQLNGTIMLANIEVREKAYNILTKEQKEKLKSIRKEKKEMRKKKKQPKQKKPRK